MRLILHSSSFYVAGAAVLIVIALGLLFSVVKKDSAPRVTTTVDRGNVSEIVSVSGVVEAKNTAELAFPVSGIVTDVFVAEGSVVKKGDVLATLASAQLVAERLDAVAALEAARADRDELLAGPTDQARSVTNQTVANAESDLARTVSEENKKVLNAKRTLLSSSLTARAVDAEEDATAPIVTGTYSCEDEGSYYIKTYNADIPGELLYKISGLETGNYEGFFESGGSFGSCGLYLQFDDTAIYRDSEWIIEIPNTQNANYQTNLNTYNLAVIERDEAIRQAENALTLAKEEAELANATPRSEALRRADAAITGAQARVNVIDAQIADRSIVATFSGVITNLDILPGETAGAEPVITLLASDAFELTARIPEIDITKVTEEQEAEVQFDAARDDTQTGVVSFISPLATEIDGVAYFEATITLDNTPTWIRSGLNADVDIIVARSTNVLRLPKRFITETDSATSVKILTNDTVIEKSIVVNFYGNDGYAEITGLNEGDLIVAP